jgi:hypothetical protein
MGGNMRNDDKRIIRDERGLEIDEHQIADQLRRCGLNQPAFYAATVCLTDSDVMHFLSIYEPAKMWYERDRAGEPEGHGR